MRRSFAGCCLVVCLSAAPAFAAEAPSQGKVVSETWDAAYLEGAKAGTVHTVVREVDRGGEKVLRTTTELDLTVRRLGDTIRMRMETGSEETPDGKVTAVFMRQHLGKDQALVMNGVVEGKQLHVTVDRAGIDRRIPWNDQVVGMYRQERLFQDKKVKPGDRFSYLTYEPTVMSVVTVRAVVKDEEEVEVLQPRKGGAGEAVRVKKRLLRVETTPDKIEAPGLSLQLPTLTAWLDEDRLPVRSQVEMPGVGQVVFHRVSREAALRQGGPAAAIRDIGISQLIPLNRRIPRPYDAEAVVYRVTLKDDDDPAGAFKADERQQVKNVRGATFEIHVRSGRHAGPSEESEKPGDEYLKSCYFIKSDDPTVRRHAREAIGEESDAWRRAQRIERWVHDNLRNKNFSEAFATADQVARTLEGDCTEHAVLTAAMCRAAGVPARTALGLVYVDGRQGPVMGFHMWTEVWAGGRWRGLDATLGRGFVGASHLKVSDHSWHDVQSLTPLLPVLRVVGKVAIEVARVQEPE